MNALFNFLWQANFSLLVFFLGYILCLRKEPCFNHRRFYLLSACLLSLALPFLKFPFFNQWYQQNPVKLPSIELAELVLLQDAAMGSYLPGLLTGMYLLVCGLFGCLLIMRLRKALGLINSLQGSKNYYRGWQVYYTNGQFPSGSFFNRIFLNEAGARDEAHKQLIVDHELVHIRHFHSYDLLLLELIKIFFWFNPVVWYMLHEARNVHEYIADTCVVDSANRDRYVKYLAQQSLEQSGINWSHYFNHNLNLNRITMIQSNNHPTQPWKYGIFMVVVCLMLVIISCTDNPEPAGNNLEPSTEHIANNGEPYLEVDQMPAPTQGMEVFYQEVAVRLKYPAQARRMGIEGRVYLEFVVQNTGELTDLKVLKGIGAGCDEAAKNVLAQSSPWNPGIKNEKPVAVKLTLPIVFQLDHSKDVDS